MAQRVLPYEYEIEESKTGLTVFGGLPTYLELASAIGFFKSIDRHLRIRCGDQGWSDRQMILALVLLNLVGGDCVEDIDKLESDEGFCRIMRKVEMHGLRARGSGRSGGAGGKSGHGHFRRVLRYFGIWRTFIMRKLRSQG